MSWFTSWIPRLPNINFSIPSGLQERFITFILKKSLGHFLKPGQLDYRQIDSQINAGYVQVNDLHLNPETINGYLQGLPLSLQDGTISSVKVQIPWPNPLASTLGFSITSLHLKFVVAPVVATEHKDDQAPVVSVAQSFVQELSPREEESLWHSFKQENAIQSDESDERIPGGLDSFVASKSDAERIDLEPVGVSVFASLIERLLARFEFDAQDIIITLIHPDNISLTFTLQDIQYLTDTPIDSSSAFAGPQREKRTLTVRGISLFLKDISGRAQPTSLFSSQDLATSNSSTRTSRPQSRVSSASSASSMSEESRLAMIQSLAMLPPRTLSPSSSAASSMYESAISAHSSILPIPDISEDVLSEPHISPETREEKIVSFGTQPIIVQLTTSAFSSPSSDEDPFMTVPDMPPSSGIELAANVSVGIIAYALRPELVKSLVSLVQAITWKDDEVTATTQSVEKPISTLIPPINVTAEIRACVALLISSPLIGEETVEVLGLDEYFEHPLVPPHLRNGYSRIFVDTLSLTLAPQRNDQPGKNVDPPTGIELKIVDFSIFLFSHVPEGGTTALASFPFLITDPLLCSQYPTLPASGERAISRLPTFDIIDWTQNSCNAFGTRISHWRCKSSKDQISTPNTALRLKLKPNIVVQKNGQVSSIVDDLTIQIAPLHIRIDMEFVLHPASPLSFFEEIFLTSTSVNRNPSNSQRKVINHSSLDRLLYDDINVEEGNSRQTLCPTINFTYVRLSVRCPSALPVRACSGTLVLDIHDLGLAMNPPAPLPTTRFSQWGDLHDLCQSREIVLFDLSFARAVAAFSLIGENFATAFLDIGPIKEVDGTTPRVEDTYTHRLGLSPRIRVIQPQSNTSGSAAVLAVSVDLPALRVHLDKSGLDAIQYWADDVGRMLERMSDTQHTTGTYESANASIIGSRFLAKSRNSSTEGNPGEGAEQVIKISITESSVCLSVPCRDTERLAIRPVYIKASDLDLLVELNAELKQQTVLTVGLADLVVENTSPQGSLQSVFNLTAPRALATSHVPIVKLRFSSRTASETGCKETRVKLTLSGFTYRFYPDIQWFSDLSEFAKNPPGTFESVIPSYRTSISVGISNGSLQLLAPTYPGALVAHIQDLEFVTDVVGNLQDSTFHVLAAGISLLAIDDAHQSGNQFGGIYTRNGVPFWVAIGYALLAEFAELDTEIGNQLSDKPTWKVFVDPVVLRLHLCADSLTAVTAFSQDFGSLFKDPNETRQSSSSKRPADVEKSTIMSSVEDLAFRKAPEIGPPPDMISDDLPTNLDYLDESFGAAAGLRELVDEDLNQYSDDEVDIQSASDTPHVISKIGGETIKVFDSRGLNFMEDYFLTIPPEKPEGISKSSDANVCIRISNGSFKLLLYDGYDWAKTRKTIEEEVKEMRKRLAKIRQLVASGQVQEPVADNTSALLYNSVHIGLEQDGDGFEEPSALIAAIDEELGEDHETVSQSSWQSLRSPGAVKSRIRPTRVQGKKLTRARTPSMEFVLDGLYTEFDQFGPTNPLVSRTFVTIKDLEILDHIKTSTWKKFLTDLRSDSRGNVRETDSDMVRIELQGIRPVTGNSAEEVRLRAKILPLRLYVDQDAVDFLKKFFSFKDPSSTSTTNESNNEGETYIQLGEIFPIDLKLDYKPRRVDYGALKEGRTIELMNFFHFDGAEMTLRHITLAGVTGWPKFFEMLNDLWTPDVKATQLVEVISGVAPIRSMVNVGSGVADLILLPISQYKKDGRIVRGVQKGATAFVKSTAVEAIKMGAKLATGTQVILEQAEGILGGQFEAPITAEPVQVLYPDEPAIDEDEELSAEPMSKYAQQPADLKEGVQSAYKSLQKNLNSAAQTILAVPMEVYERSGNEGPVRSVIRAVPIAVLKPMIGASEAVSKTLLGLHNTLDPNVRHENDAKYKFR